MSYYSFNVERETFIYTKQLKKIPHMQLFGYQVVVPTNYSLYHAPVKDTNAKMEVPVLFHEVPTL